MNAADRSEPVMEAIGKTPKVSVIIRTKNVARIIGQTLKALYSQRFNDFELIVVDSGSTDATLDIVRRFPARVIHMEPNEYLSGRSLNLGASHATADILVFQNSDTVPLTPDALGALVSAFDDPTVDAAFARQRPRPEAWSWVRLEVETAFPDADHTPPWIPFAAPFSAMRKRAWEEHPFFEGAWGSEDTEWGCWARTNGKRVQYVKESLVMHSHNHNLRQLYGRLFTEGEALAIIHRDKASLARVMAGGLRGTARDWAFALRHADLLGLFSIPIRRWVMHRAYYQGHKFGEHRLATGDDDPATGQNIILKRYEG